MGTSKEVIKLCSKKLRFGDVFDIVGKYWGVRPVLVCLSCLGIDQN